VPTRAAGLRIAERTHQHLVVGAILVHESVVELVGVHHQVAHAVRDGMVVVDDDDIKRVVAAMSGALAPQQADHAFVVIPAIKGVVGGMDDGYPTTLSHRLQERCFSRFPPTWPVVVEHDQVELAGGVLGRARLQVLLGIVGDGDRESAGLLQTLLDGGGGPSPVMVIGSRHEQSLDGRLLRPKARGGGDK
jgi:hypothetical protein